MKNYKYLVLVILLFLYSVPAFPQNTSKSDISEVKLWEHLNFMASGSLEGRGIQSSGLRLAAEYLKENLQKIKLSSPEYGYLQQFKITALNHDTENSFIRMNDGENSQEVHDFIAISQSSDTLDVEGELVFGGFGDSNLSTGGHQTELKSAVDGKVVIYSAGTLQSFQDKIVPDWNSQVESKKMNELFSAGAKALIIVTSIHDTANATYHRLAELNARQKFYLSKTRSQKNKMLFVVTPETAGTMTNSIWASALKSFSMDGSLHSCLFNNHRVQIHSRLKEQAIETANVIGWIEGADSLLKDECVLFMAHYDHLGIGKDGVVYNGADDNASGVATLLEVAAGLADMPEKPRRTILFLFPSAEETGLLGSAYYSRNPLFPFKNTVACINLDMVGRVYEPRDSLWKNSPKLVKDLDGIYALVNNYNPEIKNIVTETCRELSLVPDFSLSERFFYTSDHYHFHRNEVPVVNLSTGYSADYHQPTDVAEKIRTDKMKRVANLCVLLAMELAN